VRITARRGLPVRPHEPGPLAGELQPGPSDVETELVGQLVQDVGRWDDVHPLVLLDPVLEGQRRRLVITELTLGCECLCRKLLGPALRLLPYLQGVARRLNEGRFRLLALLLRVLPG